MIPGLLTINNQSQTWAREAATSFVAHPVSDKEGKVLQISYVDILGLWLIYTSANHLNHRQELMTQPTYLVLVVVFFIPISGKGINLSRTH
jgi:hypothetical protein